LALVLSTVGGYVAPDEELVPWLPEDDLFVLIEAPVPPHALAAYAAIERLREAAIRVVVTARTSGSPSRDAIAELEQALLAGTEPD
jgi:hypothetical protein